MSTQNLELVEGQIAAFNAGAWETMELLFWPDAEALAPEGWPEAEDNQGWPAIKRQFQRLKDAWTEDEVQIRSSNAIDDERVFVHGIWHTSGKGSGIETDLEIWILGTAREGRISRIEFYIDGDLAKRAAGI